jgi:formylglycine-generating enzyme required for sulfatase activity
MANTWRGTFPWRDLKPEPERGTSRVGTFPPNAYGLFDMIGNVWEWTKDDYAVHGSSASRPCCGGEGAAAEAFGHGAPKVLKGGSYLCSPDHCARYRPAARQPQTPDTSSCHIGFRCVVRVDGERG